MILTIRLMKELRRRPVNMVQAGRGVLSFLNIESSNPQIGKLGRRWKAKSWKLERSRELFGSW